MCVTDRVEGGGWVWGYKFNKTKPETLASLVKQIIKTDDEIRGELKRFKEITQKLFKILVSKQAIKSSLSFRR